MNRRLLLISDSEASGQIASSKGEIKDDKREDDVDDGKSHGR
jgi:hypothetical protein